MQIAECLIVGRFGTRDADRLDAENSGITELDGRELSNPYKYSKFLCLCLGGNKGSVPKLSVEAWR